MAELTAGQQLVLDRLGESPLADRFYFSGGSALAAYYLDHRSSLDLDFFSRGWPQLRYILQQSFLRVDRAKAWPATTPEVTRDQAAAFFRDLTRSLVIIDE